MKKQIFFLAVAAIAMASCSQDETIGINEGKGIGFRTSADKLTRGAEITTNNITEFNVSAFDPTGATYFKEATFTGKQGEAYVSNPLYYWPGDDTQLTFRAYAPTTGIGGTMTLALDDNNNTLTGFSPANDIKDQVDLIYATATGKKSTNETNGVQLDFKHMLSQIEIKAKNKNTGYIYKVKGVKIAYIKKQGDLDFDKAVSETTTEKANAWSNLSTDKADYTVEYDAAIVLNSAAQTLMTTESGNAMLIPQRLTAWNGTAGNTNNGAYLAVQVNVETKDGAQVHPKNDDGTKEYAWVAVGIGTEWEMGNKYIYTLDFSEGAGKPEPDPEDPDPDEPVVPILGGPIKFTVDVTGWVDKDLNPDLSWDADNDNTDSDD